MRSSCRVHDFIAFSTTICSRWFYLLSATASSPVILHARRVSLPDADPMVENFSLQPRRGGKSMISKYWAKMDKDAAGFFKKASALTEKKPTTNQAPTNIKDWDVHSGRDSGVEIRRFSMLSKVVVMLQAISYVATPFGGVEQGIPRSNRLLALRAAPVPCWDSLPSAPSPRDATRRSSACRAQTFRAICAAVSASFKRKNVNGQSCALRDSWRGNSPGDVILFRWFVAFPPRAHSAGKKASAITEEKPTTAPGGVRDLDVGGGKAHHGSRRSPGFLWMFIRGGILVLKSDVFPWSRK